MPKSIISEGKTTNEAIDNGLKKLNVSRDKVDIKILDVEQKRSFFSILAPRVVKVELTLKENINNRLKNESGQHEHIHNNENNVKEYKKIDESQANIAMENIKQFLEDFLKKVGDLTYEVKKDEQFIHVEIKGSNSSQLIGYRGEVLNYLQVILSSIANKNCDSKIRVTLNIENYKEKREKALEELADKLAKTVLKNGKSVTLEPMAAYERKIIHNRLQNNKTIKTYSVGEEPYRKVVIAKNK